MRGGRGAAGAPWGAGGPGTPSPCSALWGRDPSPPPDPRLWGSLRDRDPSLGTALWGRAFSLLHRSVGQGLSSGPPHSLCVVLWGKAPPSASLWGRALPWGLLCGAGGSPPCAQLRGVGALLQQPCGAGPFSLCTAMGGRGPLWALLCGAGTLFWSPCGAGTLFVHCSVGQGPSSGTPVRQGLSPCALVYGAGPLFVHWSMGQDPSLCTALWGRVPPPAPLWRTRHPPSRLHDPLWGRDPRRETGLLLTVPCRARSVPAAPHADPYKVGLPQGDRGGSFGVAGSPMGLP